MAEYEKQDIERSETAKEKIGTNLFFFIIPGIICVLAGLPMVIYRSWLVGLGAVLLVAGVVLFVLAYMSGKKLKDVKDIEIICPFCQSNNVFTDKPMEDVRCGECSRMIPIENGEMLNVYQVQCGYCRHLNYYSDKSTGLICENCDSVIPIATEDGPDAAKTFERFTLKEDNNPYDLVLLEPEHRSEKLIACLQKMLALNRNQIKDILDACPATLFSGIPRRKAEYLVKDIELAGGAAEYRLSENAQGTN